MKLDIAISIPTHGAWENDFAIGVMAMISHTASKYPGLVTRVHTAASSILLQNRYDLVRMARNSGSTHMLWLDDDMTFPPDTLVRLLRAEKGIVGANYISRKPPHAPVAAKDEKRIVSHGKTGIEKADHMGLGVCLMAMDVFEAVPSPYFYFGWSPKDEQFIGEDVWFFRAARKAGYELWVDHDLSNEIGHIGTFEYTHDLMAG
jgi:hypothetical protein